MYTPTHFAAPSDEALHEVMRAYPFATLVIHTGSEVNAQHLPLYLEGNGTLSGHVARANPVWQEAANAADVLVIFHGPNAYVSPAWYPTKARNGHVVPTWNYVVVHARGKLRVVNDPHWIHAHLQALTAQHEAAFAAPWRLEEAPAGFIDRLMLAVVGIEIEITELTGKWKVSQNQPLENQLGVMQGLSRMDNTQAKAMAAIVQKVNRLKT